MTLPPPLWHFDAVGGRPPHHWNTTTFLAGLRHDGIVAPFVFDGPIKGEAFVAWTERFLAPVLRAGDIVIADRLSSHKSEAAREVIVIYERPQAPWLGITGTSDKRSVSQPAVRHWAEAITWAWQQSRKPEVSGGVL